MFKKEKIIRFTSIALIFLIIFSLITVGFKTTNRRINYGYKVDDQPGTVHLVQRAGKVKIFAKPDAEAKTSEKMVTLQDSVIILPSSLKNTYGFVLAQFPDKSQGWIKLSEINRNFYPKGRETEVAVLNFLDKFGTLKMLIIMGVTSLGISFLLFRFYPKINIIFTKRSRKAITGSQEPWFFLVAMIAGIALGYLFFFYRGMSVKLIVRGDFFIPYMELENLLLFLSFWGYIATIAILVFKSIKDYGINPGIWRALFYVFLMLVVTIANFFFISAAIYVLIIILLFLGAVQVKQPK